MMSPMDFFSSITPDCSIHPGAGSGIYEEITEERLPKTRLDKSPAKNSVLNVIGENGLISYNDYCFLLALMATPLRFIDTAFNVFDVTGDGKIEVKVKIFKQIVLAASKLQFCPSFSKILIFVHFFRSLLSSQRSWLTRREATEATLMLTRLLSSLLTLDC